MLPDLSALSQMGGPPPQDQGAPPDDTGGGGEDDSVSILQQMLELADHYRQVQPDEEDKASMEQARTLLQSLLAKDQKEKDGLLQGKASPGALRRVLGNGSGGY
jgi:hypothetical protein